MTPFTRITFRYLKCLTLLLALLAFSGCIKYVGIEGTYDGKVIDADSNEPIEGAVAHGVWYTFNHSSGRTIRTYFDSREALTDNHGEFSIPGQGLMVYSNIDYMGVTIFKSGYEDQIWPIWCSEMRFRPSRDLVEIEEDRVVFKLKKIAGETRQKRLLRVNRYPRYEPIEKCKLLNAEIARDKEEAGDMKKEEKLLSVR